MTDIIDSFRSLTELLDRGQWKHTQHVPRRNGCVLWHDPITIAKIKEQLKQARCECADLQRIINTAQHWISSVETE